MSTTPDDAAFETLKARVADLEQALASMQSYLSTSVPAAPFPPGTFSSADPADPAVQATGTNGPHGVDASSDSGVGVFTQSGESGIGLHAVVGPATTPPPVASAIFAEAFGNYAIYATNVTPNEMVEPRAPSRNVGIYGQGDNIAVQGESGNGIGVYGYSDGNGPGVWGQSGYTGVYGQGPHGGVIGYSDTGAGVWGLSNGRIGVFGYSQNELAGYFAGNVEVTGTLFKPGGGFQIDHPLDSANKYLSHSFVESPDMKNLYDGVVTLDVNGRAEVLLPAWFEALNTDIRYQLTGLGSSAPVYIDEQLQNNRFTIAGGTPGMEVCWQVTGIRQDRWARAHRLRVEQDKPAEEQGFYLYPDLYGEPEEKSLLHARYPDLKRPVPPRT